MRTHPIEDWLRISKTRDRAALQELLADDVVFHSPVVHTPQEGKALTARYLGAAFHVLFNHSFRYVRQIVADREAVLEFTTQVDGIEINGIDLISWNAQGHIADFKVMIRPLKAIQLVHQKMREALENSQT